jgi:hypothetical protein
VLAPAGGAAAAAATPAAPTIAAPSRERRLIERPETS